MKSLSTLSILLVTVSAYAQFDAADVAKIVAEGKDHNNAFNQLRHLTKQIGPRVTGSPQLMAADIWAMKVMRSYGLKNVHLEQWGVVPDGFWRGPKSSARMVAPYPIKMTFSTPNWSPGTKGEVQGPAYLEPKSVEDVHALGAKLRGAWIIMPQPVGMGGPAIRKPSDLALALDDAKIAGRIYSTGKDIVWSHGSYTNFDPKNLPTRVLISLDKTSFDEITLNISKGKDVQLAFNVDNRFTGKPQPVYDVVGDLPGTDKPDEIIGIGGHFDSWNTPGSEGAMDNGTGSMVALEAARIIQKTGVSHKRTLRVILYSGEEEGLLGSRGYVSTHLAEMPHFMGLLNDDGGTNPEIGFTVLKGAENLFAPLTPAVKQAFPEIPFNISYGDTMPSGGSDHGSFLTAGVPAIEWGKAAGPVPYVLIWHTQNDNLEHVYKPGLVESSTVSAITAYLLLNSDETMPRPPARRPNP